MNKNIIKVFTSASLENLFEKGGSGWWTINESRAKMCDYVLCVQNINGHKVNLEDGGTYTNHHTGFLLAEIGEIITDENSSRKFIKFKQYAKICIPNLKCASSNPIGYTNFAELNLDSSQLEFKELPLKPTPELTIEEAKAGLSLHYKIDPSQITINIKF